MQRAETVRRQWLAQLLARKNPPKGALRFLLGELAAGHWTLCQSQVGVEVDAVGRADVLAHRVGCAARSGVTYCELRPFRAASLRNQRADNSRHLLAAARRRSEDARRRATASLRRMDGTTVAVNFDTVARQADVSWSGLYTQPAIRAEIERLRARRSQAATRPVPERQRISDASLRSRLAEANARVRELQQDNQRLRTALAEALGTNRDLTNQRGGRDTPERQETSRTIRPCSQGPSTTLSATQKDQLKGMIIAVAQDNHRANLRRNAQESQGHRPAPRRDQLPDPGLGRPGPGLPWLAQPDHDFGRPPAPARLAPLAARTTPPPLATHRPRPARRQPRNCQHRP